MKHFVLLTLFMIATPVFAQGVDWDKIGKPLGEDSVDLYDRYVYFDETKVANPNVSLKEPLLSISAMQMWITDNMSQVMTLSAQGYRQELKDYQAYFTEKGLRSFINFLDGANVLSTLDQGQFDLTTLVQFTPDILADAALNDVYRWNADVPLVLSFRNSNDEQREVLVNIDVVRVPFGQNSDGLAFDHWEARVEKARFADEPTQSDTQDQSDNQPE